MDRITWGLAVLGFACGAVLTAEVARAQDAPAPKPLFSQERMRTCENEGAVFVSAAKSRDEGMSPEVALMSFRRYIDNGTLAEPQVKRAINRVYFDPGFVNARGPGFYNQMGTRCLWPNSAPRPLQ